ncbi:hypothetical protein MPTK1_7g11970 [Marchantia polymorpha subsp. ruderalis]|uniref:Uncharacterized protein n=2 Tax=Marchantia polymorpha TaxID=3197 RepID=A0AAF6BYL6_MARPO|nr:hypothetical protein MARPO_0003s0210 [Marchantia polymorpha]BBN17100.1 hypothetical protein Mp_7g11970 [Marchantia polymorpha subsp. ruderalis]|eukprot:PTQ49337.1 hypothetical protein MARPO_0003s0210 [Marchantia polymorpha]
MSHHHDAQGRELSNHDQKRSTSCRTVMRDDERRAHPLAIAIVAAALIHAKLSRRHTVGIWRREESEPGTVMGVRRVGRVRGAHR